MHRRVFERIQQFSTDTITWSEMGKQTIQAAGKKVY